MMEPTWEINWDHDGWRVELTRYPSQEEYVTVVLQTDGIVSSCIVYGNKIDPVEPPWPFNHRKVDPTNPAEVCAMCERLANQHTISPTPAER